MAMPAATAMATLGMSTTSTEPAPPRTEPALPRFSSAALLQLIWLASPALPIGGFSYSEGLEAAIEAGLVSDEASAQTWLIDQLHLSLARCDLPLLCLGIVAIRSHNAGELRALDDWSRQSRETAELRLQSEQMGTSLQGWQKNLGAVGGSSFATQSLEPLPSLSYPLAFAQACAGLGAAPAECAQAFAFGWCENIVAAAVKAVPLGQSAGQRLLQALAHDIEAAVNHALRTRREDLQAFTPMLAILSSQHEHQYSRLFRS